MLLHQDLLVRIIQLNGEFSGQYWLWRRRNPAILPNLILRERWLSPLRYQQYLSK